MTHSKINTIDVHELKKKMNANPNLCLIDVRELEEWEQFHIAGAVLMPKESLPSRVEAEIPDKNQPIYLHCKGGVRSLAAAQLLLDLGYHNVYSVDGGIMQWANSGYPITQ